MERIVRLPNGEEITDAKAINTLLDSLSNAPKKDIRAALQGINITAKTVRPYDLKLQATVIVASIGSRGKPVTNNIYETADLEVTMDNLPRRAIRLPIDYYFFVRTSTDTIVIRAILDEAQNKESSESLPAIEALLRKTKNSAQRQKLKERYNAAYTQLINQLVARLIQIQQS